MELQTLNEGEDLPLGQWDWYKYIRLSGLVNVDASHWSKPYFGQGTYDNSASSYITLSTANLNVDAAFGDWVSAHVGFLYMNGSSPSVVNFNSKQRYNRSVNVEDAYGTIANFSKTPFYFRAGQQYVPFGRYHIYPITQSLTQILSKTNAPALQAGFVTHTGFNGALFALSGESKAGSNSTTINNYGLSLGYSNFNHAVGYDFGLSYLRNMADIVAMEKIMSDNNGYTRSVGGLGFYGDLYAGPFGFGLRYVMATRRFSPVDYQYTDGSTLKGAKPSAGGVKADYNFKTFHHNSRVDIGYQWSSQAHNTATGVSPNSVTRLPKSRWLVGYGVNLVSHVALGLQYYQEQDYNKNHGGTNRKNNVVTARVSFMF